MYYVTIKASQRLAEERAINISIDKNALGALCRKHEIRKLALFGSVVRSDFDPRTSDIDVLVEFQSGRTPGLFRFAQIIEDLSTFFGRRVDLLTYKSLTNPIRRASILEDEEIQYVEAG